MKYHILILLFALVALPSCNSNRPPQMVKTTTTRAVPGLFGAPSGSETVTIETPYDPFGEDAGAAGKLMFSRP